MVNELPSELMNLIIGGGINLSVPSTAVPINQFINVSNFKILPQGLSNESVGTLKHNTNRPVTAKIQGLWVFKSVKILVSDGNLYEEPLNGGTRTLISSSEFSTTNRVRGIIAQGNGNEKLYLFDGANGLKSIAGSSGSWTVSSITLPAGFTNPNKGILWRERLVLGFADSSKKDAVLFSRTEDADDFDITSPSTVLSAFSDLVSPSDGSDIVGFGVIKQKNADAQTETLLVTKSNNSTYQADSITLGGSLIEATFNRLGIDIGSINQDSIVNLGNDIYFLNKDGVRSFTSVANAGVTAAQISSESARVNYLIQQASKNTGFINSFILHNPADQTIYFFMTKDQGTQSQQYEFTYPEIPNDFTICYTYGVASLGGEPVSFWSVREGAGWAWSAGTVYDGKIYLGSYFGDIYELNVGDDYEPSSGTDQSVFSVIEFGDWILDSPYIYKQLCDLIFNIQAYRKAKIKIEIFYDQKATPVSFTKYSSESASGTLIWNQSKWNEAIWAGFTTGDLKLFPTGSGKTIRIRLTIESKILGEDSSYYSNSIILHGLKGTYKTM